MSIYVEEMLAQIESLDAFCDRPQKRMKMEPVPSGLEVDADELTARIKEVERDLPPGLNLGDWSRKAHWIRYYLARREPDICENDLDVFREQNIQAFVILTERLRAKYGLKSGTDGPELVNQIYGAKSALTTGMDPAERQSMRDYLAGAYGLLWNKYAYSNPPLDLTELEAALATVNVALKMLRSP